jgi:hypothetical protein
MIASMTSAAVTPTYVAASALVTLRATTLPSLLSKHQRRRAEANDV